MIGQSMPDCPALQDFRGKIELDDVQLPPVIQHSRSAGMACIKRQRLGYCEHFQCPYPTETEHGYECLDLVGTFCEVGKDCLPKCPHSWSSQDVQKSREADEAFERETDFYDEEYKREMGRALSSN